MYLQSVQDLQIDARASRTPYQFTLEDANPDELAEWLPRIMKEMDSMKEIRDVTSDYAQAGLGVSLQIDRDTGLAPRHLRAVYRRRPLRRVRPASGPRPSSRS